MPGDEMNCRIESDRKPFAQTAISCRGFLWTRSHEDLIRASRVHFYESLIGLLCLSYVRWCEMAWKVTETFGSKTKAFTSCLEPIDPCGDYKTVEAM